MMKLKTLCFALFLFVGTNAIAQTASDDLQVLQGLYGKEKRALIEDAMNLNEAEAAKFWPLYDAYETARKEISTKRWANIQNYANSYNSMSNEVAESLMSSAYKNNMAILKLEKEYFKKVSKALSPVRAAQFIQIEDYLQNVTQVSVWENLPFIGEIKAP